MHSGIALRVNEVIGLKTSSHLNSQNNSELRHRYMTVYARLKAALHSCLKRGVMFSLVKSLIKLFIYGNAIWYGAGFVNSQLIGGGSAASEWKPEMPGIHLPSITVSYPCDTNSSDGNTEKKKVTNASLADTYPNTRKRTILEELIIPVNGVRPDDLRDSYTAARSGGRVHQAIDIFAPLSTPVLAAFNGKIMSIGYSPMGGNTIYQMTPDGKYTLYYAHLESFAENLKAGTIVHQGDVIGFVGNTGNAQGTDFHLHFAIWRVTDIAKYRNGINLNPYSFLAQK